MDIRTIARVQQSWKAVEAISPQAAALFYRNLFEAEPALRRLFPSDLDAQGTRLMGMIAFAVARLEDLDALVPALRALGVRHLDYGVEDRHYALVGDTLLKTLAQGLGDAFTAEVEIAWAMVYSLIAQTMLGAAHAAEAQRNACAGARAALA